MSNWSSHRFYNIAKNTFRDNQLKILDLLDGRSADRLLDIGCSDGSFTIECGRRVNSRKIYGVEISELEVAKAKEKGVDVFLGDASNSFPFADKYFDVIIANQVLEHIYNVDNMLREVRRCLKQNGIFVLSVPNLCSIMQRLLILWGNQPTVLNVSSEIQVGNFLSGVGLGANDQHIHAFAPPALKGLVKYYGFRIVKTAGVGFYPFGTRLSAILSKLDKNCSVYQIIVAAKGDI